MWRRRPWPVGIARLRLKTQTRSHPQRPSQRHPQLSLHHGKNQCRLSSGSKSNLLPPRPRLRRQRLPPRTSPPLPHPSPRLSKRRSHRLRHARSLTPSPRIRHRRFSQQSPREPNQLPPETTPHTAASSIPSSSTAPKPSESFNNARPIPKSTEAPRATVTSPGLEPKNIVTHPAAVDSRPTTPPVVAITPNPEGPNALRWLVAGGCFLFVALGLS